MSNIAGGVPCVLRYWTCRIPDEIGRGYRVFENLIGTRSSVMHSHDRKADKRHHSIRSIMIAPRNSARRAALFAVAIALAHCVSAQSWNAVGSSPFLWSNQSPLGIYRSVNTMMMAQVPRASSALPSVAPSRQPLSATRFSRSPQARMPQAMATSAAAGDRSKVAEVYAAMLSAYDQLLRESGEDRRLGNNVAGAITFLLTASHYARNDGAQLSNAQQEAILQDLNAALAATPAFRALSNVQKQEMFETAAITGAYILTMYKLGTEQRKPEHVKTARDVADLAIDQMLGTSLSTLSLENGLRIR